MSDEEKERQTQTDPLKAPQLSRKRTSTHGMDHEEALQTVTELCSPSDCIRQGFPVLAAVHLVANSPGSKEGNVLFNDTLNTFYLRLYGVRHMVKDHSDSKRGNLLSPHGLLFLISSKGSFICIIPQTG